MNKKSAGVHPHDWDASNHRHSQSVLQCCGLLHPLPVRPHQPAAPRAGDHQEEPVHLQGDGPGGVPQPLQPGLGVLVPARQDRQREEPTASLPRLS